MWPAWVLLVYVVVVFLGGALVAPWLYALVQGGAAWHEGLHDLAGNHFYRYVNRAALGLAILGLWPTLRILRMNRWEAVGLGKRPEMVRQLGTGFLLGWVTLAVVALLGMLGGARQLTPGLTWVSLSGKLLQAGLSAVVVGCLEELLFRGFLFGALRRAIHWKAALVGTSLFYAAVHFTARPPAPDTFTWFSGLTTLGALWKGVLELENLVPGLMVLTLVGAVLTWGYVWSGSLYFSIGLHAGWIFWLKFYGATTSTLDRGLYGWWGSAKLYDGWSAFFVLSLVLTGCMLSVRLTRNSHGDRKL